jgi:thiamine biosynthesis lipoprotein
VSAEAHLSFECFGGTAAVHVLADGDAGEELAAAARRRLLDAHRRLSRFDPRSELSRLNADPRTTVPASPLLRRLATAVVLAGSRSGGLVDATLLGAIERAGYRESLALGRGAGAGALGGPPVPREPPIPPSPEDVEPRPARPHPAAHWRQIRVDETAATITRPPCVGIDSGGLAKGLLADLVAATLTAARSYAVDCCGDLRLGGEHGRRVLVEDPFGGAPLHELVVGSGGVATSGIARRSWDGPEGPAHHLLDPASGRPAHTGIVQATAVAPTALLAEVYAKAALLSGPERAAEWLPHGGVTVGADGGAVVFAGERPLPRPEPVL